jgi:hypothetical protein
MAITLKPARQEVISAKVGFLFSDLTSGAAVPAIQLPANSRVLDAVLRIETAFNSGTSDALTVRNNEGTPKTFIVIPAVLNTLAVNTVASAAGVLSNVVSAASAIGYLNPVQSTVDILWAGVGTAATTGAGTLEVTYVVENRAAFSQG